MPPTPAMLGARQTNPNSAPGAVSRLGRGSLPAEWISLGAPWALEPPPIPGSTEPPPVGLPAEILEAVPNAYFRAVRAPTRAADTIPIDAAISAANAAADVDSGWGPIEDAEERAEAITSELARLRLEPAESPIGPRGPASKEPVSPELNLPGPAAADEPPGPTGELGQSTARISVGQGEERVDLWIAVRGESVRVEARAHSAAYAEALNQRSHELAAGLADRGLALGSLSADAGGRSDTGGRPDTGDPGSRGERQGGAPDREPDPDRPRPRGLRAIA